jgi:hypothetical protein
VLSASSASPATMQACPCTAPRLIDLPPGDWEFVMGVNIGGSLRHPPFRRCVSIAEHVQDSTKPRCNAPPR